MIAEDLKRWLSVRVVGRLELQVGHSNLLEEHSNDSHQVGETNTSVGNESFALVELSQMSRIQSLVPEDSVDGKVFDRFELLLLSQLVKHLRTDGSGMGP